MKFKDVVDSDYDSHLIYEFKCPGCNAGYIGETQTYFKVRSSQHLGISEFTGEPTTAGNPTSVTKHIREKECNCTLDNFRIIGRESDWHRRLIKESIFVKLNSPSLNDQQTSTTLYLY